MIEILDCDRLFGFGDSLEFFIKLNKGLFFHSIEWTHFISELLGAENRSFFAVQQGKPCAFFPLLVKNGPLGKVANSSPYYGSNGGIIVDLGMPEDKQKQIKETMLNHLLQLEKEQNFSLICIITNPLYQDQDFYQKNLEFQLKDCRIGQLTPLPESENALFPLFHSKTRNIVRKAQKGNFNVFQSKEKRAVSFLYETHKENMERIGGLPKDESFFINCFTQLDNNAQLWIAAQGEDYAAALLLFTYGEVIEYFTPVVKNEYREMQPLSLLIYEAMISAVREKKKWWNWGGTWKSQDGVYHFKSRWGTNDFEYFYFIRFSSYKKYEDFIGFSKEELLLNYPCFFTVPFNILPQRCIKM